MLRLYGFNNKWKLYFRNEKALLLDALENHKYIKIEHIGATSIVLGDTCGTIDLLLSIRSKVDFFTIKNQICRKGYEFVPTKSDNDMFFFIRRNSKREIIATIRLVEYASDIYNRIKMFQFYLREKDEHVLKYNEFKHALVMKDKKNIKQYEDAKKAYIQSKLEMHCKI